MNNLTYICPLCENLLTKEKWIKITGQWEEQQKFVSSAKKEIEKYKSERKELEKKFQIDLKKASKTAESAGIEKGIKKEKSERERMSKLIQTQTKALQANSKKIQELEKQLKEGKTPQIAGFDYEKEVQKMLSEAFPDDEVQATGKKGDALQLVKIKDEVIGSILYECKKTDKYQGSFILEIKRHQDVARADYAVVVTHAQKEKKSKFFIEQRVIVIDPLGLLDIAFLLRTTLLDIHQMKLTKEQKDKKGQEILMYMQSGDFRKNMVDNLEKTRSAYNLLVKEVDFKKKDWEQRLKIYSAIHQNTQNVRFAIGKILTGKELEEGETEKFPTDFEILKLQSG